MKTLERTPLTAGINSDRFRVFDDCVTTAWIGSWSMMKDLKIDIAAAGGVDLDRLGRSLQLHGERVGDGRYHVTGGEHDHWVDLYTTSHPRCDCGDHLWRERICKHILAALLREGNETVVRALGSLFERLRAAA
jgi:SWIM zinc finger